MVFRRIGSRGDAQSRPRRASNSKAARVGWRASGAWRGFAAVCLTLLLAVALAGEARAAGESGRKKATNARQTVTGRQAAIIKRDIRAWSGVCQNIEPASNPDDKRVAFVIGNGGYGPEIGYLYNPTNDAVAVTTALTALGFRVYLLTDGREVDIASCFKSATDDFAGASVKLLYYSGHGIQIDDKNYLLATDTDLSSSAAKGLVTVQSFIDKLVTRGTSTLLFLDACRNNPFAEAVIAPHSALKGLSVRRGLASITVKQSKARGAGLFIGFSTAPNRVAADGKGKLSPFTAAFVKHIATPGQSVQNILGMVTTEVGEATNWAQTPWTRSSLTRPVRLNGGLTLESAAAKSKNWAKVSKDLLAKGLRQEAIAAALKGLPATSDDGGLSSFGDAHLALYRAVKSGNTQLPIDREVSYYAINPDRSRVLVIRPAETGEAFLELWNAQTRKLIKRLLKFEPNDVSWVDTTSFSGNGRTVVTKNKKGTIFVWDAQDGRSVGRFHRGRPLTPLETAEFLSISPDGSRIAASTSGMDGLLRIFDTRTGAVVARIDKNFLRKYDAGIMDYLGYGFLVTFDDRGRYVAFSVVRTISHGNSRDPQFTILGVYDLATRSLVQHWRVKTGLATNQSIAYCPHDACIAFSYFRNDTSSTYFSLWSPTNGKEIKTVVDAAGGPPRMVFKPDGSIASVRFYSEKQYYIDTKTGAMLDKQTIWPLKRYEFTPPSLYSMSGKLIGQQYDYTSGQFWRSVPTGNRLISQALAGLPDRLRQDVEADRLKYRAAAAR